MFNLSANVARVFKLNICSLIPVGTINEWGMVISRSCSFGMGRFFCVAGDERQIIMSAGPLRGASGINPAVGSTMMVS